MSKVLILLCFLPILFIGCQKDAERENARLRLRVAELESEVDSLRATVTVLTETPESRYRRGVELGQNGDYEKADEVLRELIDRFPENKWARKAGLLISENESKIASTLFYHATRKKLDGDRQGCNELLQRILSQFPTTESGRAAKKQLDEDEKVARSSTSASIYPGVWGADGEFRTKSILPFEQQVHDALKRQFDLNPEPSRESYGSDAIWLAAIEEVEAKCIRTVADEFGIDYQTAKDIWSKVEFINLGH